MQSGLVSVWMSEWSTSMVWLGPAVRTGLESRTVVLPAAPVKRAAEKRGPEKWGPGSCWWWPLGLWWVRWVRCHWTLTGMTRHWWHRRPMAMVSRQRLMLMLLQAELSRLPALLVPGRPSMSRSPVRRIQKVGGFVGRRRDCLQVVTLCFPFSPPLFLFPFAPWISSPSVPAWALGRVVCSPEGTRLYGLSAASAAGLGLVASESSGELRDSSAPGDFSVYKG